MKRYIYKALTDDGRIVRRSLSALSLSDARARVGECGMQVVEIGPGSLWSHAYRMKPRTLALFCQEWSALLAAGLPMTEALSLMAGHRSSRERTVITETARRLETGMPLRDALSAGGAFPPFFLALVAVGEMSGTLPDELSRLAAYYEGEADFRRKLLSASAYPLCLCLFVMVLFTAILTVILPSFSKLFDILAVPMPPLTAHALALGLWLSSHGLSLLAGAALVCLGGAFFMSRPQGEALWDRLLFRSAFMRRLFLIRLCHALASLMESGCPLSEALYETARLSGNQEGAARLRRVRGQLIQGGSFPEMMCREGLTTPLLYSMTAAGMESGELPRFLQNAARLMTGETMRKLETFQSILGPALLILSGAMVALLLFAVMMPIFSAIGTGL